MLVPAGPSGGHAALVWSRWGDISAPPGPGRDEKQMNKQLIGIITELGDFLKDNTDLTDQEADNLLIGFMRLHNLLAMHRYFKWAQSENEPTWRITATLMHDLSGMLEPYFSPRTAAYSR